MIWIVNIWVISRSSRTVLHGVDAGTLENNIQSYLFQDKAFYFVTRLKMHLVTHLLVQADQAGN